MTPITLSSIQDRREDILRLAELHGAHNVRIFGSVVRGEATGRSDVDLLVTMDDDRSLLDRIALMRDLKELLGRKVDVVNHNAISDDFRELIASEIRPLMPEETGQV